MQYDKFEQLVKKLASFAKLAFKHLTKIIISASAVLAVIVTLLATRGIIVGAESCPHTVTYGEELGYSADAFLSGVTYEYSRQGVDDWTPEMPVVPGTYRVRAVAKATFGYRYGKPEVFTILPKEVEVEVTTKSMIYGELPGVAADTEYEDRIYCDGFIYNDDRSKITADTESIYVLDKNGNDVTDAYIFTTKERDVVTNPRPITLESVDATIIYDGEDHTNAEYKISRGSLAAGDTLSLTFVNHISDVGEVESVFTYKFENEAGEDVTEFYLVDAFYGTTRVLPRPVTVKTESGDFVYNGEYNSTPVFELEGELVDGHKLTAANWAEIIDVGTKANVFTPVFTDRDGRVVTQNYELTFAPGTLTVTHRPIKVTTPSETRMYSSEWWSNIDLTVEGLAPGDSYGVVEAAEAIWVGTVENTVKISVISDGRGVDVTKNYAITYVTGTLTVVKRPLHIITESATFTYDGHDHGSEYNSIIIAGEYGLGINERIIVHSPMIVDATPGIENRQMISIAFEGRDLSTWTQDNYDITYEYGTIVVLKRDVQVTTGSIGDYYNGMPLFCTDYAVSGLSSIHYFVVKDSTKITNAGYATNEFTEYDIVDEDENSVLHNYNVSFTYGTIEVYKRPVIISTATAEKVYDGTALREHSWIVCEDSMFELVLGDSVASPTPSGSQTNVGTSENGYTGAIRITNSNGVNVTHNYDITVRKGTLTVLPRPIMVRTGSGEAMYDDRWHSFKDAWVEIPEMIVPGESYYLLCDGHTLKITRTSEFRDVTVNGEPNVLEVAVMSGRTDVSHNYVISYTYGTVSIIPRPITVTTNGIDRIYDDKYYSDGAISVSGSYGLCSGHRLNVIKTPEFRDVIKGTINAVQFVIQRSNGDDVTGNYDIEYKYGSVTIHPRPITVTTNSIDLVYDDKYHKSDKVSVSGSYGLCSGHRISDIIAPEFRDAVKDATNEVGFTIRRSNGDEVTQNYDITYKYGTVNIRPRPITLITNSFYGEYDGQPHGGEVTVGKGTYGLVSGHKIQIVFAPEFRDVVDNAENIIDIIILADERNVTANYEITFEYGRITIYRRVVSINTESKTWPYDGKPHEHPKYSVDDGYSFVDSHTVSVKDSTSITEVGYKSNAVYFAILDENKRDVTDNYDIRTSMYGYLTITASDVTPPDGGSDYGDISIGAPIGGGGGGNGGGGGEGDGVLYYIVSDTSGNVYLKLYSYGDYTGSGWRTENDYDKLLLDYASAYYLTTLALENNGEPTGFMKITATNGTYVLPYYSSDKDAAVQKSDVIISGDASEEYCVYYYSWDGYPEKGIPASLKQFEREYRKYVHEEYLKIDAETLKFMQGIIASEGFDIDDPLVIDKIATYISEAAVYSLKYDRELDKSGNVAVAFLDTYQEGICQHFATAATMLYRALGIPARYTVGFVGKVDAGEISKITPEMAHAWVEVYIDGIGWVKVEVTGESADGEGSAGEVGGIGGVGGGQGGGSGDGSGGGNGDGSGDGTGGGGGSGGGGSGGGKLDGSGMIGAPELGDGAGGGAPAVVYTLVGSSSGQIYLKFKSFGDYAGTRWKDAEEYGELMLDGSSAYYLASLALAKNGAPQSFVSITSEFDQYVLPYYAVTNDAYVQTSDALIEGDAGSTYVICYFTFDGYSAGEVPASAAEFETAYRQFVHNNYLAVDDETRTFMQGIIDTEGFNLNDPYVITAIAEYVKNAAVYDMMYDRELDKCDNIAVAFLDTYKAGICQHYATAATMLYRTLGIPARYTIGYLGETVAGAKTEVTSMDAHAWVEVYIDGVGWMVVEVTGAPSGGASTEKITVTPMFQYKEYDGTPLYAEDLIDETNPVLANLLAAGYTYLVKVGGSQTGVGVSRSYIESFVLYDPDGNDVTDKYEIIYEEGELRIGSGTVEIYLYEKRYEYNGSAYSYDKDDYVIVSMTQGIRFVINGINISMTNVGSLNSNEINNRIRDYIDYSIYTDGSDTDVSDYYVVRVVNFVDGGSYTPFEILPREITVTTGSATKVDDGSPLQDSSYYVSQGTLAEGHTLTVQVIGTATSKGSYPNTVNKQSIDIVDEDGVSQKSNYVINLLLGTLTIT